LQPPWCSPTRLTGLLPATSSTAPAATSTGPATSTRSATTVTSTCSLPNPSSPSPSPFATFVTIPEPVFYPPDEASGPNSSSTSSAAVGNSTSSTSGTSSNNGSEEKANTGGSRGSGGTTTGARGASIDPREASKFAALAASWWRSSDGPFAPLHALNPVRVRFIRQSLASLMGLELETSEPLKGLRVLDVGCGGGILSEALARLGAEVHGIDVTRENVEVAGMHVRADPRVAARVRYDVISAEDLAASGTALYDVVIASEVLEHVNRPHELLPVLTSLLSGPTAPHTGPGGSAAGGSESGIPDTVRSGARSASGGALIVSTLNRTPSSFAVAIAGAEYLTGLVPKGTHHWRKFITPEELAVMAAYIAMDPTAPPPTQAAERCVAAVPRWSEGPLDKNWLFPSH
ncbi:hypothetical protein VOLCADRAFT_92038, partial [Volvox carteri f. nagariensis]